MQEGFKIGELVSLTHGDYADVDQCIVVLEEPLVVAYESDDVAGYIRIDVTNTMHLTKLGMAQVSDLVEAQKVLTGEEWSRILLGQPAILLRGVYAACRRYADSSDGMPIEAALPEIIEAVNLVKEHDAKHTPKHGWCPGCTAQNCPGCPAPNEPQG